MGNIRPLLPRRLDIDFAEFAPKAATTDNLQALKEKVEYLRYLTVRHVRAQIPKKKAEYQLPNPLPALLRNQAI